MKSGLDAKLLFLQVDMLNNLRQQRQAARITAAFNRLEESGRFGREFGLASGAFTRAKSEEWDRGHWQRRQQMTSKPS